MLKTISQVVDTLVIHLLLLGLYAFLYYNIYRFSTSVVAPK